MTCVSAETPGIAMHEVLGRRAAPDPIMTASPVIERIVCGHLHRPVTARWHGTVLSVAPSTAHQMGLNMLEGAKQQIVMEPPACQLHLWQPDTGIVSHTSYTGRYEIPLSIELP